MIHPISQSYTLLQQLSDVITELEKLQQRPHITRSCTSRCQTLQTELKTLSSQFFSLFPHDFGFQSHSPVISTIELVEAYKFSLELLAGVDAPQQLQKEEVGQNPAGGPTRIHPLELQYWILNTEMEPLDVSDKEYQLIQRYVDSTTTWLGCKLKIASVIKIKRLAEEMPHKIFKSLGNHKLLWHGTRASNVAGILSKGLQTAPWGSSFNNGAYFADSVSKASGFCRVSTIGIKEVALGKSYEDTSGQQIEAEQLRGRGFDRRATPSEDTFETMDDGVVVPIGQMTQGNLLSMYPHSEYVVYRDEQIKLRYLITFEFS
uniref:Poly [ADP-ribose] polymerase n=1 Tax=Globisporangium ultimum (strain ATCC 200006 / CBS 805.95 / DAOM BR144) TaxID=431595 RepID=K3W589_GLOUD